MEWSIEYKIGEIFAQILFAEAISGARAGRFENSVPAKN
jgi:hypothetical protein